MIIRLYRNSEGTDGNGAMPDESNVESVVTSEANVDAGEKAVSTPTKSANWFDDLPNDFKNNPSITKFKSKEDLAKSYLEVQKMVGKDKVVVPTDKSSKEERDAFYNKIGRPSDSKAYQTPNLELPDVLKSGLDANTEAYKAKAHELGLTQKQFAELYGMQAEMSQNTYNQILEKQLQGKQTTATELRKEFGAAYESKVDLAQKVVNTFFTDEQSKQIITNHLLSNAGFAKAMMSIGEKLGEDVLQGKPTQFTLSPAAAELEYNKLINDPKFFEEFNPERKQMVNRSIELLQMMEAGR